MRLIGLAGYAGTGKDTVADILVRDHDFSKFSFSDALYREVSEAFQVPEDWLKDRAVKDSPQEAMALERCPDFRFVQRMNTVLSDSVGSIMATLRTPREILQWWGTAYRRHQDPDYWIDRADDTVNILKARGRTRLVNCSVRFENEALWVRNRFGGEVWQVVRDIAKPNDYVSEHDLDDKYVDRIILNKGSISDLEETVARVMRMP